jgi:hypothetical protein
MNISFRYKIKVLSQVAPPAARSKECPRGPLIAVEGDSAEVAKGFADWLRETLNASNDLAARLVEGPKLAASGGKEEVMAQYHRLASDWLFKSKDIMESIAIPTIDKVPIDDVMPDALSPPSAQSGRHIEENYDDTEIESRQSDNTEENQKSDEKSTQSNLTAPDNMELDKEPERTSTTATIDRAHSPSAKPISIIANYSLSTSNLVACLIPLGQYDPYSPNDHWQWTATQWRGIVGPDLTIYIRDAASVESGGPPVEIEGVEGRPDVGLFVMSRTKTESQDGGGDGTLQVEASVLRRMGFEVGEWVRAFETTGNGNHIN